MNSSYVGFLSSSFRVLSVLRFWPFTWVSPSHPSSFHSSRCRLVFSHGSSPSGVTFLHRFRLPSTVPALSLSLPHFLRCYSFSVLSAPSGFVSFLLVYMTYCSLFRLCSWVLRCPVLPSVFLRFCILPGARIFLIHGFRLLLGFSLGSFFRASVVLPCDFSSTVSFSLRTFRRLPSLATVSSVPMSFSFFLCVCGIGRLALLFHTLPLLSMVSLPLSFLPVRHFPFVLWALF